MTSFTTPRSYDSICCFRGDDSSVTQRLLWEITTRCNLGCPFCHRTIGAAGDITHTDCRTILPFLKAVGIQDVIVSGGEPLLNRDLFLLLRLLKDAGLDVDMCTNGTLVTRLVATRLKAFLTEVSVSIDSHDPAIHDALRGWPGAWQATVAGIRALQEQGLLVHTISLVNARTLGHIQRTAEFLHSLGVGSIAFIGRIPLHAGKNVLLTESHQATIVKTLALLRARHPDIPINSKELVTNATMCQCRAGHYIYGLDVNLTLRPCILLGGIGGVDLRRAEERTLDALLRLREEMGRRLACTTVGQGLCPGSRLLNGR